jgi:hypothetical protein
LGWEEELGGDGREDGKEDGNRELEEHSDRMNEDLLEHDYWRFTTNLTLQA